MMAAEELTQLARRLEERQRAERLQDPSRADAAVEELASVLKELARLYRERLRAAERLESAVAAAREAGALTAERVRALTQVAASLRGETLAHKERLTTLSPW
jgi:hypothetical protein